jgi:hypothetical protein
MSAIVPSGPLGNGQQMTSDEGPSGCAPPLGYSDGLELEYPDRLVTPPSRLGHAPFALWLVGALRPRILAELGVHRGNSYCAFLQGVEARKLDTRCFGIDHWRGDEHSGFHGDEIYEELRAHHDPLYGTFSTLLRSSFDDALPYFSDGSIDLLHIDGFHTYEAVAHNFRSWLARMSARGVVLLHDTNARERGSGSWRLWEEIVPHYPTFEFTHSCGLGIAYVGSAPLSGPLEALFGAKTDAETKQVRGYFARLGKSVVERFSLHELTTKVDATHAHLAVLEAERQELRSELTRTTASRDALARAHQKAEAQVHALETDLRAARLEAIQATDHATALAADCEAKLRAATLQVESQTSLLRRRMLITVRLHRELIAANQELRAVSRELQVAIQEKSELERNLDQVFRSRSWRLTVPIRSAGATLRRVFGRST